MTHLSSVGAANGGQGPAATFDGWYQIYAAVNANNSCALTEVWEDGRWRIVEDDCSNNGVGNATLYHGAELGITIKVCQTPQGTCSGTLFVPDNGA